MDIFDIYRAVLKQTLQIINYQNNQDDFVHRFIQIFLMNTIMNLITQLPEATQIQVLKEINENQDDLPELERILTQYFTEQQLREELSKALTQGYEDYIKEIEPTLDPVKREKIKALASQISANTLYLKLFPKND